LAQEEIKRPCGDHYASNGPNEIFFHLGFLRSSTGLFGRGIGLLRRGARSGMHLDLVGQKGEPQLFQDHVLGNLLDVV
jgi:hypothetical protein